MSYKIDEYLRQDVSTHKNFLWVQKERNREVSRDVIH